MVDLVTEQLDLNQPIIEQSEVDQPIGTRYFEDYLFNILTDLNAINDDAVFSLANLGAGEGVFAQEVDNVAQLKSLVAGTNITITADADEITINSGGGGTQVDVGTVADSILTWDGVDTWTEITNLLISFGSPFLDIRSTFDGGELRLRADDAAGVTQNLFVGDPDGSADIYHDGAIHVQTDTFGAIIPTTGAFTVPVGTTAQEPAAVNGMFRYDNVTGKLRGVESGAWADLIAGGSLPVPTVESSILTGDLGGGDFDELSQVTIAWTGGVMTIQALDDLAALQSVMVADADGALELSFDGSIAFRTHVAGIDVLATADDDPFIAFFQDDTTTRNGFIQTNTNASFGFRIISEMNGLKLDLIGEDAGGTRHTLFSGDPDDSAEVHFDGEVTLFTHNNGASIQSIASQAEPFFAFNNGSGVRIGFVQVSTSNDFLRIVSELNGSHVLLRADDTGGTETTLFEGDPDGSVDLYFDGSLVFSTESFGGSFRRVSGTNTAIQLLDAVGTLEAQIDTNSTNGVRILSFQHGEPIVLLGEDAGGVLSNLMVADPDAALDVYYNGSKAANTNTYGWDVIDAENTGSARIVLKNQSGTVLAQMRTQAAELEIKSEINAASVTLKGNDTGGTLQTGFEFDPDVGVAFNGSTPFAAPTYTVTNVVTDRAYDANATSVAELADVLGTLIDDLRSYGLLV